MIQHKRFTPQIDLDVLWRHEGCELNGRQPSKASQRLAARLQPEAISLVDPVAHFSFFRVRECQNRTLFLENEIVLTGGFVEHLLGNAQEIGVIICTVGSALDAQAKKYFEAGKPAHGYLLDALGIVSLGTLAEQARAHVEAIVNARGLEASTPISPGHADWKLSEQQVLFSLLPSSETGIHLSDSFVMQPKKSLSMVVGLGRGMITHAEGSQCEYCPLKKTCPYRRLPGDSWYPTHNPLEEVL